MRLVKKNPGGWVQTQILREMGNGTLQWNGEDSQPRWKEEGSEGLHVVAWMKPTDVSGVTSLDFNYFNQTYWVNLCGNTWTASLWLCHGLVLLAVVYFHIYLQESTATVIFLLHFQSSKISFQNHNFILAIFPLSLSVTWNPVHPPAQYFSYISKNCKSRDLDLFAWLVQSAGFQI